MFHGHHTARSAEPVDTGASVRVSRVIVLAALSAFALVLIVASPASAHAALESTSPAPSDVVASTPAEITLHFDEPVALGPASLRLFDSRGNRLDNGGSNHPGRDPRVVAFRPPRLGRGSYVVAWRVVSEDGHPVEGAFVFSVGAASYSTTPTATPSEANLLAGKLASQGGSPAVGFLYWIVRALAFAGMIGLVGTGIVLTSAWPGGWSSEPVRKAVSWSWLVLLGSTVAAVALQGLYAASLPLTRIFNGSIFLATLQTRFGVAQIAEVVFLLLAALLLEIRDTHLHARGRPVPGWWDAAWLAVAAGLLASPLATGHASSGRWVVIGVLAGFFHYAAISVWLGALVLLFIAFVRAPERVDLGPAVPRVSNLVYASVVVVVASGVVQSIRQVGSFGGLVSTAYGRLLLAKIAVVCVLVGLGAASRMLVHGRLRLNPAGQRPPGRLLSATTATGARLRRLVAAELAVSVVVLALTSLLVNAPPANQTLAQPVAQTVSVAGVDVTVVIEPAHAGPDNQFHIYTVDSSGLPADVSRLQASMSLSDNSIGPFFIPLINAGLAHFVAQNVDIPIAGSWRLRLVVGTPSSGEKTVTTNVAIH